MKIAILNECFLKDSHIKKLKRIGEISNYKDTDTEQKATDRLKGIDIALADCFLTPLNQNVFKKAPSLKYLTLNSTGFDLVDTKAAKKYSILISNIPGYATEAVAEHTIALMFAVARNIIPMDKKMRKNPYEIDPVDTTQLPFLGFNLKGKTIGIIGFGTIGQQVAKIAHALGMTVLVYTRSKKSANHVSFVSLKKLLKSSDVISLHTPLTAESENLIGEKEFSLMKEHAVLINTARGKIVNTEALYTALKNKTIGGAGLDVFANITKDHPILQLDNVVFTPHAAWYTKESFDTMADMLVANVEAFIKGKPINLIT